ncbi:hypothetical protein DERP_003231 [Dermatophagoides pteronyssinus]|uniref:Uncharacterized protein n=1 Tax=Dermatophagoides pteronyssinus TaxID=6956 RepID=A0ABQ8JIX1_DERPT|nr:hypothetical protein DERP_003231 [Dermatophagoides pteronyssinus]
MRIVTIITILIINVCHGASIGNDTSSSSSSLSIIDGIEKEDLSLIKQVGLDRKLSTVTNGQKNPDDDDDDLDKIENLKGKLNGSLVSKTTNIDSGYDSDNDDRIDRIEEKIERQKTRKTHEERRAERRERRKQRKESRKERRNKRRNEHRERRQARSNIRYLELIGHHIDRAHNNADKESTKKMWSNLGKMIDSLKKLMERRQQQTDNHNTPEQDNNQQQLDKQVEEEIRKFHTNFNDEFHVNDRSNLV